MSTRGREAARGDNNRNQGVERPQRRTTIAIYILSRRVRQIRQLQWKQQQQQHMSVSRVDGESHDRIIGEHRYNTFNSSSVIDPKLLQNSTHRGEIVLLQHGLSMSNEEL